MRLDLDQSRAVDAGWGIAVVRLMMGLILVVAGVQKWANGIGGTINFFTQLGIPAPQVVGPIIAAGEVVGGLLVLVGLASRYVGIWFVCEFIVTAFYVKLGRGAGWDAARIDLMLLAGSLMLVLAGAGQLALDRWRARRELGAGAAGPVAATSPR
jgi:putative oxidoreductase